MGVRELWSILDSVGQPLVLSDLKDKRVAIDLSIWIRECESIQYGTYLRNIFWRILHMLQNQVTPVFVIEGRAPQLKHAELDRRLNGTPRTKSQSSTPSSGNKFSPRGVNSKFREQLAECRQLLDALGVCHIQSGGEAEATCAQLNLHGLVHGCITQDGDAFLFGARTVYRNFTCDPRKEVQMSVYHMEDITSELGLNRRHLIGLGLLLGCDYDSGVQSIGKKHAMDFMKEIIDKDPLDALADLKAGKLYVDLEAREKTRKGRHCNQCKHPGGKDIHKRSGCTVCQSEKGCEEHVSDESCPCDFHVDKRKLAEHSVSMKIRKHVLDNPAFPSKEVVDAFLHPSYAAPERDFDIKKPNIQQLKEFNATYLHWNSDKMEAGFVPLLTAWDRSHPEETSLIPQRIIKISREREQKVIHVEWKYEDKSLQVGDKTLVITKERYDLMIESHPNLVEGFEEEQQRSETTPSKRKLEKAAASSHKLTDMFGVKKRKVGDISVIDGPLSETNKTAPETLTPSAPPKARVSLFSQFQELAPKPPRKDETDLPECTTMGISKGVFCPHSPSMSDMMSNGETKASEPTKETNPSKMQEGTNTDPDAAPLPNLPTLSVTEHREEGDTDRDDSLLSYRQNTDLIVGSPIQKEAEDITETNSNPMLTNSHAENNSDEGTESDKDICVVIPDVDPAATIDNATVSNNGVYTPSLPATGVSNGTQQTPIPKTKSEVGAKGKKSRSKKSKVMEGQKKISDMFAVKKLNTESQGLKMVLFRK